MFTYEEKKYMLSVLKKQKTKAIFRKPPEINDRIIAKLEQMIRNEEVNERELRNKI